MFEHIQERNKDIRKAITDSFEKGRKAETPGTIKEWKGEKYQKMPDGSWIPVKDLPVAVYKNHHLVYESELKKPERKEDPLLKQYLGEFEVIDKLNQHPSGLNFEQWKAKRGEKVKQYSSPLAKEILDLHKKEMELRSPFNTMNWEEKYDLTKKVNAELMEKLKTLPKEMSMSFKDSEVYGSPMGTDDWYYYRDGKVFKGPEPIYVYEQKTKPRVVIQPEEVSYDEIPERVQQWVDKKDPGRVKAEKEGFKKDRAYTNEVIKVLTDNGWNKPHWVDRMTNSYRIKLGSADNDAEEASLMNELKELFKDHPGVQVKKVGTPYGPFGKSIGLIVPFEKPGKI